MSVVRLGQSKGSNKVKANWKRTAFLHIDSYRFLGVDSRYQRRKPSIYKKFSIFLYFLKTSEDWIKKIFIQWIFILHDWIEE
jgi:hypothetical protein